MIEGRLQEFGLSFERHIVATISDGPNVMKRLVLESPVEGFFCWNHAIHLAVLDVIFTKPEKYVSDSEVEESENEESDNYDVAGKSRI